MKIISHRGYWKIPAEKNTAKAFSKSFAMNFGVETDVRDYCGQLVVSHDPPTGGELFFHEFLEIASTFGKNLPIAINVKADGLANLISKDLKKYNYLNVFVFDMSVPDMRGYISKSLPIFTRLSEVERQPAWVDHAKGIWLDSFEAEWYGSEQIMEIMNEGKQLCVVSPELHGRDFRQAWDKLHPFSHQENLMLCTDFPEEASIFFGE
ncbi:hypothetical protein MCEMSE6_02942 [Oxalobacteraceae bacterium]